MPSFGRGLVASVETHTACARRHQQCAPLPPTTKTPPALTLCSLLPQGVTQPPVTPKFAAPKFGFVDNAEILNSRAAMLGFFGILAVEAIAGKGIFEMVGLTTGNGLPFDF